LDLDVSNDERPPADLHKLADFGWSTHKLKLLIVSSGCMLSLTLLSWQQFIGSDDVQSVPHDPNPAVKFKLTAYDSATWSSATAGISAGAWPNTDWNALLNGSSDKSPARAI